MLFKELDKLKRTTVMMGIILMLSGIVLHKSFNCAIIFSSFCSFGYVVRYDPIAAIGASLSPAHDSGRLSERFCTKRPRTISP